MNLISKNCRKCFVDKVLNRDNFHLRKTSPDGFNTICKNCVKTKKPRNIKHIDSDKLICLRCKAYKEDSDFDNNSEKHYRRYRDSRCKICKAEQREKRRVLCRGNGSIERVLLERYLGVVQRAKTKSYKPDFNSDYLLKLWNQQDGKCAISGIRMTHIIFSGRVPTNVSIDKIDSKEIYKKGNIQLVCMAVNQMKSDLEIKELVFFCRAIVDNYEKDNVFSTSRTICKTN